MAELSQMWIEAVNKLKTNVTSRISELTQWHSVMFINNKDSFDTDNPKQIYLQTPKTVTQLCHAITTCETSALVYILKNEKTVLPIAENTFKNFVLELEKDNILAIIMDHDDKLCRKLKNPHDVFLESSEDEDKDEDEEEKDGGSSNGNFKGNSIAEDHFMTHDLSNVLQSLASATLKGLKHEEKSK